MREGECRDSKPASNFQWWMSPDCAKINGPIVGLSATTRRKKVHVGIDLPISCYSCPLFLSFLGFFYSSLFNFPFYFCRGALPATGSVEACRCAVECHKMKCPTTMKANGSAAGGRVKWWRLNEMKTNEQRNEQRIAWRPIVVLWCIPSLRPAFDASVLSAHSVVMFNENCNYSMIERFSHEYFGTNENGVSQGVSAVD